MSIADVFRHDLLVVRRSKLGKTVLVLSVVAPLAGILLSFPLSGGDLTFRHVILSTWLVVGAIIPLGAVLASATAIVGDRESGRLRLLLGSPTNQSDVLFGTFCSRLLIVEVALVFGLLIAILFLWFLPIPVAVGRLGGFVVFTPLVCASYVAIGIAASTATKSQVRTIGLTIGIYIWTLFWPQIARISGDTARDLLGVPISAELAHFIGTLSPFGAYSQVISDQDAIYGMEPSTPLLGTGAMAVVLGLWIVGPLVFGYRQFTKEEL